MTAPRWIGAGMAAASLACAAATTAPPPVPFPPPGALRTSTDEPRAFGWRVGDVVQRHVAVEVPPGLDLDETALPPLGRHGTALELRDLAHSVHRHLNGAHRYDFRLAYQVFQAPLEVHTYELPPLRLVFKGQPHDAVVQVAPWPLSVTPLTPLEASARRGLGDFRPDAEAPRVPTRGLRNRIAVSLAAIVALLAYLAAVYIGLPWRRASRRPFQVALRTVRAAQTGAGDAAVRIAFQAMHDALNKTAGRVLFDRDLDRLLATEPRYAALRSDLAGFFARSRTEFFAGGDHGAGHADTLRWLADVCRRLRDAERGSP